jgi:hypothetical protein
MVSVPPEEFEKTLCVRCRYLKAMDFEGNIICPQVPKGKAKAHCIYFEEKPKEERKEFGIPEPLTKIGHAVFGFLSALSILVHPILIVISFALFLVYELDEEWSLCDEAYEELREYGYGLAPGLVFLLLLPYLTKLIASLWHI